MNLLEETLDSINKSPNIVENIIFIGSEFDEYSCSWEEFKILSNHDYGDDHDYTYVAEDLIIVFRDGARMKRSTILYNYKESDFWEYIYPFKASLKKKNIKNLFDVQQIGDDDFR